MLAVSCMDLVKEYHAQKTVRALDGVSLEVEQGEVFGLLGPNGAGKTTLVRILATLLLPTSGRATVAGYDVRRDEAMVRSLIGYAGQDSERSAYFRLTVRQNLVYFAHALRGVPLREANRRIDGLAEGLGVAELLDKHFSALSGGQKQLVIVMRSLLHWPSVVFMDEPSKSLDPVSADRVRECVLNYAREHAMTVLLTTHNMREAEEFCGRIGFINRGRLRFVGTPSEFKRAVTVQQIVEVGVAEDSPAGRRLAQIESVSHTVVNGHVRLYCDDAYAVLRQVIAALDDAGISAPVRVLEPSLEDAYSIFVHNDEEGHDG